MSDTFRKHYNNTFSELHAFEKEMKEIATQLEGVFKLIEATSHEPSKRCVELALMNLEQSVMWATKGLYSKNGDESNG